MKGLLVLVVVLLLGLRALGASESFSRLRYVSEAMVQFVAILAIVVFQPEIRQGMVRIGQALSRRGRRAGIEMIADAVEDAVRTLSKGRIGAIMVIERNVSLEGMAANGVTVDAVLDARLLESLFWPNSPLHDLAVVIRGNRIAAASVELPLAETGSLSSAMGSRHRAAVGATLDSDALVVVVSEETGKVVIAEGGTSAPMWRSPPARSRRRHEPAHLRLPPGPHLQRGRRHRGDGAHLELGLRRDARQRRRHREDLGQGAR
jgi:diadenylate cyclase